MTNAKIAEKDIVPDEMEALAKRVAAGDAEAAALYAKLQTADEERKKLRAAEIAQESAESELKRARDQTGKSRKVKTGISLVSGGTPVIFEDVVSAVINYVQDHGGDIQSIDFGMSANSSTHTALIQYTISTAIAKTVTEKLREVHTAVKAAHRRGTTKR